MTFTRIKLFLGLIAGFIPMEKLNWPKIIYGLLMLVNMIGLTLLPVGYDYCVSQLPAWLTLLHFSYSYILLCIFLVIIWIGTIVSFAHSKTTVKLEPQNEKTKTEAELRPTNIEKSSEKPAEVS